MKCWNHCEDISKHNPIFSPQFEIWKYPLLQVLYMFTNNRPLKTLDGKKHQHWLGCVPSTTLFVASLLELIPLGNSDQQQAYPTFPNLQTEKLEIGTYRSITCRDGLVVLNIINLHLQFTNI